MDSNKRLAQMIINLFGHWQLLSTDQVALLGGLDPVDLAYLWVAQPNRRFGNTPPLEIMKKGHVGLVAVRRYLDFERER